MWSSTEPCNPARGQEAAGAGAGARECHRGVEVAAGQGAPPGLRGHGEGVVPGYEGGEEVLLRRREHRHRVRDDHRRPLLRDVGHTRHRELELRHVTRHTAPSRGTRPTLVT